MVLSNTTTKAGLLQKCEFWTRKTDGEITGDATQKLIFTHLLNNAFESIMPILLAYNDQIRWDDTNHTDAPSGTFNLVANQNDYKITEDDNSLDILNITHVRILRNSGDTQYYDLERITSDDPRVPEILKPNTAVTGIPTGFLELGNRLYLDILPSTSITNGVRIIFSREQYYFIGDDSDDTKEPGIPKPFHELLALYAALDWNSVNRGDDTNLLNRIQGRINKMEADLNEFIDLRHPSRPILSTERPSFR